MDDDDRDSNAFSENDQDEVMEDVDEPEAEPEAEPENDPEEDEEEADEDDDAEPEPDTGPQAGDASSRGVNQKTGSLVGAGEGSDAGRETARPNNAAADGTAVDSAETMAATTANSASPRAGSFTPLPTSRLHLRARPEALNAKIYDIVPTMAAPQATSINALAVTPDLRYWMTGGSDGYIRKYDGPGTINGRQLLTVAQRHPFVDSVVKAGILMSYWENEEPPSASARGAEEHILSPVYSLAVHSRALWLLAGTEGGGINLQSVRHDEGKRITCLQRHTNAVSVLQLAPDEKGVLSGSWDKTILDWDLNTGLTRRDFDGSSGQISAIEPRPASGAPIPAQGSDEEPSRDVNGTLSSSNAKPLPNGVPVSGPVSGLNPGAGGDASASGASATISGDDPLPDHESLFGSPGGSLFGGSDAIGAIPFGDDDMGMTSGAGAIGDDVGGFPQDVDMVLDTGDATMDAFAPTTAMPDGTPPIGPPSQQEHPTTSSENIAFDSGYGSILPNTDTGDLISGDKQAEDNLASFGASADHTSSSSMDTGGKATDTTANAISPLSQQQQQQRLDQELQKSAETQLLGTEQAQVSSADAAEIKNESSSTPKALANDEQKQEPSAMVYSSQEGPSQFDPTQVSDSTFFSASIDGPIQIWDRRQRLPAARIRNRPGVPPWCMGACWSPDGNRIYAGRRNGTVEEFDIHKAKAGWQPERSLRFPAGSGPVSAVRAMVNGRHLVCASHDILRLYDIQHSSALPHSNVPFLIIPGPPRAGVISHLYIDQTSRFMISTAGTRGWEGTNTEALIGYEISSIIK
ncbi:Transcription factor spt8 [Sporothrix eucalyptigena]|uniref:Transcription factor spt8 n=1 Tax=Sporothrix eucalyptigena TaxID=1812306 RepID=A0ABP0C8V8_9PEZI